MQPAGSPASPKPRLILLALSVALALIGTIGAATGAADNSDDLETAAVSTTTTTSDDGTTTTSTSTVATSTTVKGNTSTTKAGPGATTTTAVQAKECEGVASTATPGAQAVPALGTFTYVVCGSNGEDTLNRTITAGADSGGVIRRKIDTNSPLGRTVATDSFGPNGVIQESTQIISNGSTIDCNWNPDITEYAAGLSVGKEWTADSSCEASSQGQKVIVAIKGTRKVTGIVKYVIEGQAINAWQITDHRVITVRPAASPNPLITVTSDGVEYYDPTRGLTLYEKATGEAKGFMSQPKTTVEIRLKSLTPKA